MNGQALMMLVELDKKDKKDQERFKAIMERLEQSELSAEIATRSDITNMKEDMLKHMDDKLNDKLKGVN